MKLRRVIAFMVIAAMLFIVRGGFCEEITVYINAGVPAGLMSGWFEPSMFAQYAPVSALSDFIGDAGGATAGMIRINVGSEIGYSASLQDMIQRLDSSAANQRIQIAGNAGAQVLLTIEKNPAWISSYPNHTEKVCSDWYKYWTYAPAADKWDEWQSVVYEVVKFRD